MMDVEKVKKIPRSSNKEKMAEFMLRKGKAKRCMFIFQIKQMSLPVKSSGRVRGRRQF